MDMEPGSWTTPQGITSCVRGQAWRSTSPTYLYTSSAHLVYTISLHISCTSSHTLTYSVMTTMRGRYVRDALCGDGGEMTLKKNV